MLHFLGLLYREKEGVSSDCSELKTILIVEFVSLFLPHLVIDVFNYWV